MAKSKVVEAMPSSEPPYDHRIEMRRKDGPMQISHTMPMGKTKGMTKKMVLSMIERMFGGKK